MKDFSDLRDFCEKYNIPLTAKVVVAYRITSLGEIIYLNLCNSGGNIVATDNIKALDVIHEINTVTDLLNETKNVYKNICITFYIKASYYGSSRGNVSNFLFQDERIVFDMLML